VTFIMNGNVSTRTTYQVWSKHLQLKVRTDIGYYDTERCTPLSTLCSVLVMSRSSAVAKAVWWSASMKSLLSHSRSFQIALLSRLCASLLMCQFCTVSGILISNNNYNDSNSYSLHRTTDNLVFCSVQSCTIWLTDIIHCTVRYYS